MTREQFIKEHPIEAELIRRGVKLIGNGQAKVARCPFHEDKSPSFSVNVVKGLWFCHSGCGGGSVIDLIAKFDGKQAGDILKSESTSKWTPPPAPEPKVQIKRDPNEPRPTIAKIYQYHDALGGEVFQVVRLVPKSFRQRHLGPDGKWIWSMEGVERVLYRLPDIQKSETVMICEGEKDADTATRLGWCGTTNVGGAEKWLDGYNDVLKDKNVIICPDNDEKGQKHLKLVFESIAEIAKSVRTIKIPSPFKDLTEYVESFSQESEAQTCIAKLIDDAHPFFKGIEIPVHSMQELESRYIHYAKNSEGEGLNLAKWLPSLGGHIRTLVPGEFALIIGDTGTGKTAILQTIALHAAPIPTLMFEIELPAELLFERFIAAKCQLPAAEVERTYASGDTLGAKALNHYFKNLFICDKANIGPDEIESIIIKSELKLGVRPKVVLVDYVQLLRGKGESRYDKASSVAESLKRVAKSTGTIIVSASQRSRPKDGNVEVALHDAKESGSLENSAGLVIGVWRDKDDKKLMHLKILKNTKGQAGFQMQCNFDGEKMLINERSRVIDYGN